MQPAERAQHPSGGRVDLWVGLCLSGIALGLFYGPRTAPTLLFERDSAEFQVLGYYLGIPHGTGYPVYIWLLKLFSLIPIGDIAFRANLFSAICGAAVPALVYRIGILCLGSHLQASVRRIAAASGAVAAAFTFTLWSQSIRAEVYTLHAIFCLGILYLLLRWFRDGQFGCLLAAAGLFSLGLGHHRQIVSLVPPITVLLLVGNRSWVTPKRIGQLAAVIAAGITVDVLLFFFLWQRDLPFDQFHRNILGAADLHGVDPAEMSRFWPCFWFVTSGRQFGSLMFTVPPGEQIRQLALVPLRILSEYFLLGTLLIGCGFAVAWREWRIQALLVAWFLAQLFINVNYSTLGVEVYYISVYLICGIWFTSGAAWFFQRIIRWLPWMKTSIGPGVAALLLLVLNPYTLGWFPSRIVRWFPREGPYMAVAAGSRPSLEGSVGALKTGRAFVRQVPPDALVFGPWQMQFVVEYVARIEQGISTLEYFEREPLARNDQHFSLSYLRRIESEIGGRPVLFVGKPPREIAERYALRDLGGNLWQVLPR